MQTVQDYQAYTKTSILKEIERHEVALRRGVFSMDDAERAKRKARIEALKAALR